MSKDNLKRNEENEAIYNRYLEDQEYYGQIHSDGNTNRPSPCAKKLLEEFRALYGDTKNNSTKQDQ